MLTIRPILHKRKKADGTCKVMICLYHPGLPRRYVSTGLSVAAAHWNAKGEIGKLNWVRSSRSSHREDNLYLAEQVRALRELSNQHKTPDQIMAVLTATAAEQVAAELALAEAAKAPRCFKAYWETYIEERAHRWSLYWKPNQYSSLKTFAEFHPEPLPFAELDHRLLNAFERWRLEQGHSATTVSKELSNLRAVFNAAIQDKVAEAGDNPFDSYTVKRSKGKKRVAFEWEQIERIEALDLPEPEDRYSRDVFLFQFYAGGRRVNEILPLTWEQISAEDFVYHELKHGKPVRVRRQLNAELRDILARYADRRTAGHRFVFPIYDDAADLGEKVVLTTAVRKINRGLHTIAELAGLPKFSSHSARHSWAELARKAGVDIYGISKNLGHSKLAVTENYLAAFDQVAVETANDAMIASRPRKQA